jgi:hypothetical protein
MTWRHFALSATVALGLALLPHHAVGQPPSLKDQLVGTWHLISQAQTLQDGSARNLYGVNPKGVNIFTADGQFVLLFMRGAAIFQRSPREIGLRRRRTKQEPFL